MISASSKCWVDSFHSNVAVSPVKGKSSIVHSQPPLHKLLPKVHHAKRAAGKLDPVVVGANGMFGPSAEYPQFQFICVIKPLPIIITHGARDAGITPLHGRIAGEIWSPLLKLDRNVPFGITLPA